MVTVMLKIIARSIVKPECMEEYMSVVKELVEKSQAEEGNITYTLNQEKDNPCKVAFLEEWKSQAAFEFHTKTEHFTGIIPKLKVFLESSEPTEFFTEVKF